MPVVLGGDFDLGSWHSRGVVPCPTGFDTAVVLGRVATYGQATNAIQAFIPTGYKRTRPGNPVASLGQFVIELRQLPTVPFTKGLIRRGRTSRWGFKTFRGVPFQRIPAVLKANLFSFRNLGSEYLNVVFGWKPFLRDLQQMYRLWATIDKQMAQIVRDNGRGVRRSATVKDDTDVSTTRTSYPWPYANVYGGVPAFPSFEGTTEYSVTTTVKDRVWYMAKYRYYIPDTSSSLWTAKAKAALFGALPTPELLWEVMPWSWLVDWFGQVGDIASNLSPNAVDNLVQDYSYTMRHLTVEKRFSAHVSHGPSSGFWSHPGCDFNFESTQKDETKLRFPGSDWSPFVPNAAPFTGFTPGQVGILAALGLSRSR
jgi:hypothetical protein